MKRDAVVAFTARRKIENGNAERTRDDHECVRRSARPRWRVS